MLIIITTKLIKQLILIEGYLYARHHAVKNSISSSEQTSEAGVIIISFSEMSKLSLIKLITLSQDHRARKWPNCKPNLDFLTPSLPVT